MEMQDRSVIVTGGASGIGRAIALGYAREGAHVVVLDANGNGAAETAKATCPMNPRRSPCNLPKSSAGLFSKQNSVESVTT